MSNPQYTKLTTIRRKPDGTTDITKESYTDRLTSVEQKIEKTIKTDMSNFLGDVVSCLDVIKRQESQHLTIEIEADKFYQPRLIIKTWTTSKERYDS